MTREQAIEKAKEQYSEIWDCDINHPKYEDTVEEIVTGVIRLIMQPTSDDCVSREKAIVQLSIDLSEIELPRIKESLDKLPPVTPTHGKCKDCKHWKDSDGVYRRGISAESKCPLNILQVFDGDFYCADFEKRGNENEIN